MWTWLNETQVGSAVFSWVKVFVAVVAGLFLAHGADVFEVDTNDLKAWLAAGLAATIPLIVNALNPKEQRYGVGSDAPEPDDAAGVDIPSNALDWEPELEDDDA